MVVNNDPCTSIEVKSDFPKNIKDFKVCYPSDNSKSFKLTVEPGQRKVVIIQNSLPQCKA